MGLESVEILIQVEDAFSFSISDKTAKDIRSPADLVALVLSRVPTKDSPDCLSQKMFYRLRRGFRAQIPDLVGAFVPKAQLSAMFEKNRWQHSWSALRESVGEPLLPTVVPWPGLFRDGPKSIEDLVWHLVTSLPKPAVAAGERWDRSHVEGEVRRIVMGVLGKENYRRTARFVEDLGMG